MPMFRLGVVLLTILFPWLLADTSTRPTYTDAGMLRRHLFNTTRYNRDIRPLHNHSEAVQVNISMHVRRLHTMHVSESEAIIAGNTAFTWRDQMLTWKPSDYGGIDVIPVTLDTIWRPELSFSEMSVKFKSAWLTSSGDVLMTMTSYYTMPCFIDTTYFPIDQHVCYYTIFSTKYNSKEVVLNLIEFDTNQTAFNSEWILDIDSFFVTSRDMLAQSFSMKVMTNYFVASFRVKRRGLFVALSSFCPGALITLLNLLTSFVPAQSGERLSYSITVFLSWAFFSMALLDSLPPNSLQIPVLTYVFVVFNVVNTVVVVWSVIIVYLAHRSDHENIPRLVRRMCGRRSYKDHTPADLAMPQDDTPMPDTACTSSHITSLTDTKSENRLNPEIIDGGDENNCKSDRLTWPQLTNRLDVCFFWLILLLIVIINIVVWTHLYHEAIKANSN